MSRFDRQNFKKTPRPALRVSEHALIRFRERVEEEFLHRGDDDLSDLLNERLHLFESRTGLRLVAVVDEGAPA
jgi:hypothetical protein